MKLLFLNSILCIFLNNAKMKLLKLSILEYALYSLNLALKVIFWFNASFFDSSFISSFQQFLFL